MALIVWGVGYGLGLSWKWSLGLASVALIALMGVCAYFGAIGEGF